jgi:hypothetical protein
VIIAQRLRKGASGSPRGAARIIADALTVEVGQGKSGFKFPVGVVFSFLSACCSAPIGHYQRSVP